MSNLFSFTISTNHNVQILITQDIFGNDADDSKQFVNQPSLLNLLPKLPFILLFPERIDPSQFSWAYPSFPPFSIFLNLYISSLSFFIFLNTSTHSINLYFPEFTYLLYPSLLSRQHPPFLHSWTYPSSFFLHFLEPSLYSWIHLTILYFPEHTHPFFPSVLSWTHPHITSFSIFMNTSILTILVYFPEHIHPLLPSLFSWTHPPSLLSWTCQPLISFSSLLNTSTLSFLLYFPEHIHPFYSSLLSWTHPPPLSFITFLNWSTCSALFNLKIHTCFWTDSQSTVLTMRRSLSASWLWSVL